MKKIFYSLGLENICDEVIETLIYTKILNPQFNFDSNEYFKTFFIEANFDMSDIEKSLDIICSKREEIKSILKKYEIPSSLSYVRKIFKTIEDRESHYLVCLLAVLVYRVLEKKLDNEYKYKELSSTLKGMELQIQKEKVAYLPNYIRTKLTDALHEKFGFRTDYEILEYSYLKGLFTF